MPNEIKIYPNPANEYITIEYPYNNNSLMYIVNESGKVVYTKQNVNKETFNVDVSNYAKGMYIIKMAVVKNSVVICPVRDKILVETIVTPYLAVPLGTECDCYSIGLKIYLMYLPF